MKPTSRRDFLKTGLVAGTVLGTQSTVYAQGANNRPPNLLFVFPDQMRPQAMGFMNEDPVLTPTLDRFAEESLVLTDAVSTHCICSPYRAMLMTGKYYMSNNVRYNCYSASTHLDNELQESDRCISDVLKDQGYSQGYIGKWHLDAPRKPYVDTANNKREPAWNEYCPPHRRHGFDFWYAYGTYDFHFVPEYWVNDAPRGQRKKVEEWSPRHEADTAMRYLRNEGGEYRKDGAPFALFVSFNPPHTPYHMVPEEYVARYEGKTPEDLLVRPSVDLNSDSKVIRDAKREIKNYFAMVTGVDEQFGRILECLKDENLDDNTIVVFTSDHGNCMGEHGHWTKGKFWDECYRVPFMIRWPGRIPVRHDRLLIGPADLTPTLLGLMGFEEETPAEVEGSNYAGIFRGEGGKRPTSALYFAPSYPPTDDHRWGARGVRTERYTMVIWASKDGEPQQWLFDNVEDPYQLKNLAEERPELLDQLLEEELKPWLERIGDPWLSA